MEREFKWDAFGALQDAVLMWALDRDADSAKMTEMDARYFDTAEGALSAEKTALRLRRENEVLRQGSFAPLEAGEQVFAYRRELGEEKWTVALNFSDRPAQIPYKGGVVRSNLGRKTFNGTLGAWEAVILR